MNCSLYLEHSGAEMPTCHGRRLALFGVPRGVRSARAFLLASWVCCREMRNREGSTDIVKVASLGFKSVQLSSGLQFNADVCTYCHAFRNYMDPGRHAFLPCAGVKVEHECLPEASRAPPTTSDTFMVISQPRRTVCG